jgi:hypothetical protein
LRKSAVALALVLLASVGAAAPSYTVAAEAKVVIIVGATHGATARYRDFADRAYAEATKYTSNVVKVYSPNATWARVKSAVSGASIVIYFGHGNGWPSPYTFDPNYTTKDGFGLNSTEGNGDYNNKYYGEPYVSTLNLAPGAVVMLHHLCYAAGNSEPGQAEPSISVAQQRVDNYAAGFLKAGAAAVIADGHAGPEGYLQAMFTTQQPLESMWATQPNANGNIVSFPSERTPGATAFQDPQTPTSGFYRSIVVRSAGVVVGEPTDMVVGEPSDVVVGEPPASVTTDTSLTLTSGTALGLTTAAPFTAPTKVTSVGKYFTWQFSGGPAMAGRRVEIWIATRAGTDPWSAFTNRTARIADAAGNAYFYLRSSSATWVSARAYFPGDDAIGPAWSPARLGRYR